MSKLIEACGAINPAIVRIQDNNLKLQGLMSNLDRIGSDNSAKVLAGFEQQCPGVLLKLAPQEKGKLTSIICRLDPVKN